MIIPSVNVFVGESIPLRYSFLSLLKDFRTAPAQTLVGASIVWTSQSPLIASFNIGSGGLVSSDQGIADGILNDAVIGGFTMLAAGRCTVQVSVSAINPTAIYVGAIQLQIEAVPTP